MRNVMYAFWDENLCVSKTVCEPLRRVTCEVQP